MAVLDDVRKYMDAALEKLSPAKAQQIARSLTRGQGREQVTKFAQDLLDWSQRNRDRLTDLVRREVRSQLKSVGVASKDEVDALKKRVRDLERGSGSRSSAKRATSKGSTAKRATSGRRAASSSAGGSTAASGDVPGA